MADTPALLVAWDVDDVLNALTREWLARFASETAVTATYDSLHENPPHEGLGISRERYLASLDAFRLERYASLVPSEPLVDWFRANGHAANHVAITATPLHTAHVTAAWVLYHFGEWIRGVHVVPSPRDDRPVPFPAPDKGATLARFRGQVLLVDDSPAQLAHARARGLDALAFPQPWNDERRSVHEVLLELTQRIGRASSP